MADNDMEEFSADTTISRDFGRRALLRICPSVAVSTVSGIISQDTRFSITLRPFSVKASTEFTPLSSWAYFLPHRSPILMSAADAHILYLQVV